MLYQVSILLKDVTLRISWDNLASSISKAFDLDDIVIEKSGTFQCKYVFVDESTQEGIQSQIRELVQSIVHTNTIDSRTFVVSARELSPADLSKLKPDTASILRAKNWFKPVWDENQPNPNNAPNQEIRPTERDAVSEEIRAIQPELHDEKDTEQMTLTDVASNLASMRELLFQKVRGQRHVVFELTQGVFESEMFSKFDANRKGPLSTFLFMGPSGVGKTFLAKEFGALSGRPVLVVDMSEYSDNLANLKFNGDHGQNAVVTGFVRKHPDALIVFDEIEKAHINTIHLFLQILDAGQLMDQQIKKEVSFRDTTIIMTTNVGRDLYDNVESRNLSNIPRNALINALKSEKKKGTVDQETVFPESITTRMANGHIIMFNHLEPYALLEIVRDEIQLQAELFKQATGITVEFDAVNLPALIMYAGGAAADARTLRGLAKNAVIKEIQDAVMQINSDPNQELSNLSKIFLTVEVPGEESDIYKLFHQTQGMQALVFADDASALQSVAMPYLEFHMTSDPAAFQKRIRGVTDFVILDPFTGFVPGERLPSDVEDIHSTGMDQYEYLLEYYPEIPIYILDIGKYGKVDFSTLLSRGARGVLSAHSTTEDVVKSLNEYSLNALIGNSVYQLGRAGKYLSYNCAQYTIDQSAVEICFAGLRLKTAINGEDYGAVTQKGESSSVIFDDIVGCKTAKEALTEFCAVLDDPRKGILSGKKIWASRNWKDYARQSNGEPFQCHVPAYFRNRFLWEFGRSDRKQYSRSFQESKTLRSGCDLH